MTVTKLRYNGIVNTFTKVFWHCEHFYKGFQDRINFDLTAVIRRYSFN